MIIMKRIGFSLSVERTPYQRRYFYIGAWTAPGRRMLRGAGRAVCLHLRVERAGRESTNSLLFFRVPEDAENRVFSSRTGEAAMISELKTERSSGTGTVSPILCQDSFRS